MIAKRMPPHEREQVVRQAMTLRAVARSANSGRFSVGNGRYGGVVSDRASPSRAAHNNRDPELGGHLVAESMAPEDAAFLAHASPAAVTRIVDLLEQSIAENNRLHKQLLDHIDAIKQGKNAAADLEERLTQLLGEAKPATIDGVADDAEIQF